MKPKFAVSADAVRELLDLVADNLDHLAATEVEDLWAHHLPSDLAELAQRVRDGRDALCNPKPLSKGIGITRGRRRKPADDQAADQADSGSVGL